MAPASSKKTPAQVMGYPAFDAVKGTDNTANKYGINLKGLNPIIGVKGVDVNGVKTIGADRYNADGMKIDVTGKVIADTAQSYLDSNINIEAPGSDFSVAESAEFNSPVDAEFYGLGDATAVTGDNIPIGGVTNPSADKGPGWGMSGYGGVALGAGQLGLGVLSYLENAETAKKQRELLGQQIKQNKFVLNQAKGRQADIARDFGGKA